MNKNSIFAGFTLLLILGVATVGVIAAGGFSPFANKDIDSQDENVYGVVEGNIIFENFQSALSDVTINIRLDDVSLADAPSKVISKETLEGIPIEMDDVVSIPYSLGHPELDERFSYTIYVHVDVDGDGKVSKGDYVTTMHNPVNTTETSQVVDVTVSKVAGSNIEQLPLTEMEGKVTNIRDDGENVLVTMVNKESAGSTLDEVVLVVSNETAIVMEMGDGGAMSVDDIKVGSNIRAYYGPMMTMSIPPISPAKTIVLLANDPLQPAEMDGTVMNIRDDGKYVSVTIVKDGSENSPLGDLVVTISDQTSILDGEGIELSVDDISIGSEIKAVYGPMMTCSLPPISPAVKIVVLSDDQLQPLEMDATVKEIRNDENSVSITVVDKESTGSSLDMIVLTIGDKTVIENESGTELSIDDIKVDSQVKAYYGPMMTRSIPPISPATRIVVIQYFD